MPETFDKFREMRYNSDKKIRREIHLISKEIKLKKDSFGQERLRNYKKASILAEKTRGYVLNPESKDGKSKAYVVKSVLGYEQADYEEFAQLIRSNLPYYRAHESHGNAYGQKYTVPMVLIGKIGRRLEVTTVWQFDNGKDFPRFITLTFKEG